MADDHWNIEVQEQKDGHLDRLGVGHAWTWTRANGEKHVFDCGLSPSHVCDAIAVRMNVPARAVAAIGA